MESLNEINFKGYFTIGIIAAFFSMINLLAFYLKFEFNALPYFELSDIINQFVRDSIFVCLIVWLFHTVMANYHAQKKVRLKPNITDGDTFKYLPNSVIFMGLSPFITVIIIIWGMYLVTGRDIVFSIVTTVSLLFILIIFLLAVWESRIIDRNTETEPVYNNLDLVGVKNYLLIAMSALFIIGYSYAFTTLKAEYVFRNNIYFRSVIVLEGGKKIIISDDLRLIGKSKSHLFIYNKKNKFTRVISRSVIKEEFLRQNPAAKWSFLIPF